MINLQLIGKTRIQLSNGESILDSAPSLVRLVRSVGESNSMRADRLALSRKIAPAECADPGGWFRVQLFRLSKKLRECGEKNALHHSESHVWFDPLYVSSDLAELRRLKSELITGKRSASITNALQFIDRVFHDLVPSEELSGFEVDSWRKTSWELSQLLFEVSQKSLDIRQRQTCLNCLEVIRRTSLKTTAITELHMKIYANLGFKQELVEGFVAFEEELLDKSGITATASTTRLYDNLLAAMDKPIQEPFSIPIEKGKLIGHVQLSQSLFESSIEHVKHVTGLPGVGKTRQLTSLADEFVRSNPTKRLIWADLSQTTIQAVREYLTHHKADVVLIDSFQADQKTEAIGLIQQVPTCPVIICGDYVDWPLPARHYTVTPLKCAKDTPSEASALLQEFALRAELNIEAQTAYRLSNACGGHPEALKIATQYCASLQSATLLELVEAIDPAFSNPWNRISDFLNTILGQLSDSARETLALLSISREPIGVQALKEMTNISVFDLNHLVVTGLVSMSATQQARVSGTLRESIGSNLDPEWRIHSLKQVAERVVSTWTQSMLTMQETRTHLPLLGQSLIMELWEHPETSFLAFSLLQVIRPMIAPMTPILLPPELLMQKTIQQTSQYQNVKDVLAAGTILFFSGDYALVVELCDLGLSLRPDPIERIELESQLGLALTKTGASEKGQEMLRCALARADEVGAVNLRPRIHYNLALSLIYDSGNYADAVTHFDQALALMEFIPSLAAQMELVQSRALAQFMIDRELIPLIETLEDLEKTTFHMKMFAERGWIISNIGEAHQRAGNSTESLAYIVAGSIAGLAGGYTFEYRRQFLASVSTIGASLSQDCPDLAGRCKVFAARLGGPVIHPEARADRETLDETTWKDRLRLQGLTPSFEETFELLLDVGQYLSQQPGARSVFEMILRPESDLIRFDLASKRLCANRDLGLSNR